MINEKKIWLCEQYAQKAWTLSLNLAQEAARAGKYGRGYAVVADETRKLADNLFDYSAKIRFDAGSEDEFRGIVEFALELGYLAINTVLEIFRVEEADDKSNNKGVAVCADDIRNLALALNELADKRVWQKSFVLPELSSPLKSTGKTDTFFRFSIGNNTLVENGLIVKEVYYPQKAGAAGETLFLRGSKIPVIDCYRRLNMRYVGFAEDRQTVMIINPDYEKTNGNGDYAVLIDDLDVNTFFRSKIAYSVPPKENHPFAEYSRECWDTIDGGQLVFVDWEKLIHR